MDCIDKINKEEIFEMEVQLMSFSVIIGLINIKAFRG